MVVITNETTPKKPSVTNELNTAGLLWLLDQCFSHAEKARHEFKEKAKH